MKQIKGIYLIERIIEEGSLDKRKYYIGLAVDVFDRWHQHCVNSEQYIDKIIQEYGVSNFVFRILETASSQKKLKSRESYWIAYYKMVYGEDTLYNISETQNSNPTKIDLTVKKRIRQLFSQDIGQSIYAIAEEFNIPWIDVVKIRKPLLKEKELTYDRTSGNVVSIKTGQTPADWRGGQMTANLAQKVLNMIDNGMDIDKSLISKADLEQFLMISNNGKAGYDFAPEISLDVINR